MYVVVNPRMHACSKVEEYEDVLEKIEEEKTNNSYIMIEAQAYGGTQLFEAIFESLIRVDSAYVYET